MAIIICFLLMGFYLKINNNKLIKNLTILELFSFLLIISFIINSIFNSYSLIKSIAFAIIILLSKLLVEHLLKNKITIFYLGEKETLKQDKFTIFLNKIKFITIKLFSSQQTDELLYKHNK